MDTKAHESGWSFLTADEKEHPPSSRHFRLRQGFGGQDGGQASKRVIKAFSSPLWQERGFQVRKCDKLHSTEGFLISKCDKPENLSHLEMRFGLVYTEVVTLAHLAKNGVKKMPKFSKSPEKAMLIEQLNRGSRGNEVFLRREFYRWSDHS